MSKGYIHLHRKIMDNPLYREKRKFSRLEAWIDLILRANGTDKEILFDGKLMLVKRGQLLTSQRQLADRWGWSKTKVRDFLGSLKNKSTQKPSSTSDISPKPDHSKTSDFSKISPKPDHSIEVFSDRKKTIITILNYHLYNPPHKDKKTTEIEEEKTTEKPLKDHRLDTTNKRNNKGIKNKDIYMSFWNDFANKNQLTEIKNIEANSTREKHLIARVRQGMDFGALLKKVEEQPFLLGDNKDGWVVTFDWIINASNYQKVIEGQYKSRERKAEDDADAWAERKMKEIDQESPFKE